MTMNTLFNDSSVLSLSGMITSMSCGINEVVFELDFSCRYLIICISLKVLYTFASMVVEKTKTYLQNTVLDIVVESGG